MPCEDALYFLAVETQAGGDELVFIVQLDVLPLRPIAREQFGDWHVAEAHRMFVQTTLGKPRVTLRRRVWIRAMREEPLRQFDIVFLDRRAEVPPRARTIAALIQHAPFRIGPVRAPP